VTGVVTNLPFLRWLVAHPVVQAGTATTAFLAEHPPLSRHAQAVPPWRGYWRLNLDRTAPPPVPAAPPEVEEAASVAVSADSSQAAVTAPTPGTVVRVLAHEGARVSARQTLLVLEAMKMETPLLAPYDATVARIRVREGDRVAGGAVLVELEQG
jgi:biotin carboxyl carrier protein